ncbi:multiubiquitin domain-containing protein [Roseateles sp. P5_E11]
MQIDTHDSHHIGASSNRQGQAIEVLDENFNPRGARLHDDRVTGRQIAEAAGFNSIDEVIVLQQLNNGALEEIRPEELVDLTQPGVERFFVIEGDATYRLFLDGLKLEWPRAKVNACTLLRLARKGDEFEVVQQLKDAPDKVLDEDDMVDLSHKGTEHFKTRKASKLIKVVYNEQPFELAKGTYTTEQLIAIFEVEPGYILDLWVNGKLVELKPGEELKLKAGMHFTSHPPRGQSS